jgi:hypothetical protein
MVGFFVEIRTERLPNNKSEELSVKAMCLFLAICLTGADCPAVTVIMLRKSTLQFLSLHQQSIVKVVPMHKEFLTDRNRKFR